MIVILDYGIGNITSILNILKKVGVNAKMSADPAVIEDAEKLILPGIGHFDHCMRQFNLSGLRGIVEKKIKDEHAAILGICVGCQMLMEKSEEGVEPGLGWIKGSVVKFKKELMPGDHKIPHMGWTEVQPKESAWLYKGIEDPRFYFVHSYHIMADNNEDVTAVAEYGYPFTASVGKGRIQGVQFHPEKSHKFGMQLYTNFANNI